MATKKVTTKAAAKATAKTTAVKPKTSVTEKPQPLVAPDQLNRLQKMNVWLALVFAVQAVAVVAFGGSKTAEITSQYTAVDQLSSQAMGHQVLATATRHLLDVRLTVAAAIFLGIFAVWHLANASTWRAEYERYLSRGYTVARWLAFGLAGGTMVATLALLGGISDLGTLGLMFGLTLLACCLVPVAEKAKRELRIPGLTGHVVCGAALTAGILPWLVLAVGVGGSLLWNGRLSGNLYAMYGTTLVLFSCWALAAHFRITSRGKWTDVFYAEKMYMFLGGATATVLAWQIFAGAL